MLSVSVVCSFYSLKFSLVVFAAHRGHVLSGSHLSQYCNPSEAAGRLQFLLLFSDDLPRVQVTTAAQPPRTGTGVLERNASDSGGDGQWHARTLGVPGFEHQLAFRMATHGALGFTWKRLVSCRHLAN